MGKFITDKWEDEPRQLTDTAKVTLLVVTILLAIFVAVKVVKFANKEAEIQLEQVG